MALAAAGCAREEAGAGGARASGPGREAAVEGRVASVTDGDTLRVRLGQAEREVRVRLIGIDAPERRKPGTPGAVRGI